MRASLKSSVQQSLQSVSTMIRCKGVKKVSFIKSIREAEGLSQEGFARISGYHRNTIQRQEAKLLPAPEFVAELIIMTQSDADCTAKKYGEHAEKAVLASVRQRISPLH